MKEVWKEVLGFEGCYEVSNLGNVRSMDRYVKHYRGGKRLYKSKPVKQYVKKGYLQVRFKKEGVSTYKNVHRLVAIAFVPHPRSLPYVNHKDGNKQNNVYTNLEWCTASENTQHALKNNLIKTKKLQDADIPKIRSSNKTLREIASYYGVNQSIIHRIKSGTAYKYVQ